MFDASLFRDPESTKLFYTFMGELSVLCTKARVTKTHDFIEFLESRGCLLRWYTQNIDGLEERALSCSVPFNVSTTNTVEENKENTSSKTRQKHSKIVQLHGNLQNVKCTLCSTHLPLSQEYMNIFKKGQAPCCPSCVDIAEMRTALGKRAVSVGSLRPDVVLYNEHHSKGKLLLSVSVGKQFIFLFTHTYRRRNCGHVVFRPLQETSSHPCHGNIS